MSKYIIDGGHPLSGYIEIHGAKNAALPILAAAILPEGISVLENVPALSDIDLTIEILEQIGCLVQRKGATVTIDAKNITDTVISEKPACKIRSSVTFLGALLARKGEVSIPYPGGRFDLLT